MVDAQILRYAVQKSACLAHFSGGSDNKPFKIHCCTYLRNIKVYSHRIYFEVILWHLQRFTSELWRNRWPLTKLVISDSSCYIAPRGWHSPAVWQQGKLMILSLTSYRNHGLGVRGAGELLCFFSVWFRINYILTRKADWWAPVTWQWNPFTDLTMSALAQRK